MQLVSVGSASRLYIPPPYSSAELPLNVQLVSVSPLLQPMYIPPPHRSVELPLNVQLTNVSPLVQALYIPPPPP